jgi:hypothetical protein
MTATRRGPPAVVPTLTHVVADGPGMGAPPSQPLSGQSCEAAATSLDGSCVPPVDEMTDRIMAHVMPRLQASITQALQAWWIAHEAMAVRAIEDAMREEIAERVRAALAEMIRDNP